MRILRDVIILAAHANPDGMELVSDWYMRKPDPKQRSTAAHAAALPEVRRPRQQPRLLHDEPAGVGEHQPASCIASGSRRSSTTITRPGPTGTVMFSPPFRDPFNYVYDPLVVNTLDQVGAAMHSALRRRGQARRDDALGLELLDVVERRPAHDGLLPQPGRPADRERSATRRRRRSASCPTACCARGDLPFPIAPQVWHFRQSIDYSITANYAVLDFAQRYRENAALQHLRDGAELRSSKRQHATPGRCIRGASRR